MKAFNFQPPASIRVHFQDTRTSDVTYMMGGKVRRRPCKTFTPHSIGKEVDVALYTADFNTQPMPFDFDLKPRDGKKLELLRTVVEAGS